MDQVDEPDNDDVIRVFPTSNGWTHLPNGWAEDERYEPDYGDPMVQRGILLMRADRLVRLLSIQTVNGAPVLSLDHPVVRAELALVRRALDLIDGIRGIP